MTTEDVGTPSQESAFGTGENPTLPRALAKASVSAALELVNPAKLSGWRKCGYAAARSALAAWQVWDFLSQRSKDVPELGVDDPVIRSGIAFGAAGVTAALTPVTIKWDSKVEKTLRKMHIPAPRVLMALGCFAVTIRADLGRIKDQSSSQTQPVEDAG